MRGFVYSNFWYREVFEEKITPIVLDIEEEAKDEGLKEAAGSPVPSPLSHFRPQGSNLEAFALIELLK